MLVSRKTLPSESVKRLRHCTILERSSQGDRPESSWKQLLRCQVSLDCRSLSAMIFAQLANRLRYTSFQQLVGPAILCRAFSSRFTPLGSLAPSIEKSATAAL